MLVADEKGGNATAKVTRRLGCRTHGKREKNLLPTLLGVWDHEFRGWASKPQKFSYDCSAIFPSKKTCQLFIYLFIHMLNERHYLKWQALISFSWIQQ